MSTAKKIPAKVLNLKTYCLSFPKNTRTILVLALGEVGGGGGSLSFIYLNLHQRRKKFHFISLIAHNISHFLLACLYQHSLAQPQITSHILSQPLSISSVLSTTTTQSKITHHQISLHNLSKTYKNRKQKPQSSSLYLTKPYNTSPNLTRTHQAKTTTYLKHTLFCFCTPSRLSVNQLICVSDKPPFLSPTTTI